MKMLDQESNEGDDSYYDNDEDGDSDNAAAAATEKQHLEKLLNPSKRFKQDDKRSKEDGEDKIDDKESALVDELDQYDFENPFAHKDADVNFGSDCWLTTKQRKRAQNGASDADRQSKQSRDGEEEDGDDVYGDEEDSSSDDEMELLREFEKLKKEREQDRLEKEQ